MYSGIRSTLVIFFDREVLKLNVNNTTRMGKRGNMQRRRRGDARRRARGVIECSASNLCVDLYTWGESHAALLSPLKHMHLNCSKKLTHKEETNMTGAILEEDSDGE